MPKLWFGKFLLAMLGWGGKRGVQGSVYSRLVCSINLLVYYIVEVRESIAIRLIMINAR